MRTRLVSTLILAGSFLGLSLVAACAPVASEAEGTAIVDTLPETQPSTSSLDETDARSKVGDLCGTRGTGPCSGKTLFCKFERTANCGRADAGGVCAKKPRVCASIYAPVCGCDGTTYSSECVANSAGVSADYDGVCK